MTVEGRDYWSCGICNARFLDPRHYLGPAGELGHYLHHENDPGDPGYRRFLSKLADPLKMRLRPGSHGLDFGCGPGPALAEILRDAGHRVELYDPFFRPDPAPLGRTYDFVVCTETLEHFHSPADEFDRLDTLLRPGGLLGIMTCFLTDDARFADWHYRRDPTHVVFYAAETMRHIAKIQGWTCDIPQRDVVLMQKPPSERATLVTV